MEGRPATDSSGRDGSNLGPKLAASLRQSACPEASDLVWRRRACVLIAVLLVLRLAYAWCVPLDLVHDEAYYWDWSRQLELGYFSKPPLIAWLIAAATSLGGSTTFVVRVPAVLLGTLSLCWMYLLATSFYGRRAGFWTVCLSAATPGNAALSLLMTIDAPFLFCWSGALYVFWRLLQTECRRGRWLAAAVACGGLGLLSKQTMAAFLVLAGVFVAASPEDRRELRRPAFWLWVLGSLLFLTPVLWWNSEHGWITAQHTSGHFTGETVALSRRLARALEFFGGQFAVLSPVTCFLLLSAMICGLRSIRHLKRRERYLLCFSALPLSGVFLLSLHQRIELNWPAAFYPSAVVLLVGLALHAVELPVWPRLCAQSLRRAAAVGWLAVAITYLFPWGLGLQGSRLDPVVRMRGWSELAAAVAERFSALPQPDRSLVVVAAGRAVASELAFYMPQQPQVYLWTPGKAVLSQYDIWGGPQGKRGWNAIIVTEAGREAPRELRAAFARVDDQGRVEVAVGGDRRHTYQLWHGVGFREWPSSGTAIARAAAGPPRR